jgi:hypothetical protein
MLGRSDTTETSQLRCASMMMQSVFQTLSIRHLRHAQLEHLTIREIVQVAHTLKALVDEITNVLTQLKALEKRSQRFLLNVIARERRR